MTSTLEMAATTAACIAETVLMWRWMETGYRVRIEMDDDWYLVGVPKIRLDGLTVRADWYE